MTNRQPTRAVTVHLTGRCEGGHSVAHDQSYRLLPGRGVVEMEANCGACGKRVRLTGAFGEDD